MSTNENFDKSHHPVTIADLSNGGRFSDDIIGEFDGPGTLLFIVASSDIDLQHTQVVEIDRHTHCVFFSRTQMNEISRYLEIALQGTPIESEVGMRTVGVVSQLAISAYYSFINQDS